ncbi:IclR family transcriptional regulator [Planosporangium mesophilum]|uniref:IclR family transcriptional regulator n=1 Tax=Planosporangium mesophilum TaxID=689768 RepID=A0A8J3T658_9ACTN|nr:IclR family transcriptional regulator [Planosporangium mesophilum]NJC81393.1 IclR family transcriptional regulator [Planosporangium mesophilum]GII20953.1 IclR family transcriptional regulator [Planosporangium mesophilum]
MNRTGSPSAIAKVVAVAEALTEHRRLSRVAQVTGLPISTVHRILRELVSQGWVREGEERDYMLGPGLLRLAGCAADDSDLARAARPALRALGERSGFTIHFGARQGDEAVYVDKFEGRGAYGMRSRVGATLPLHSTAIGKAILAALPVDEVRRIAARTGLPRRMPRTLATTEALLANLATVRARGWALDDEENTARVRCVGAVVVDHRGEPIGAVSVSGLSVDLGRVQVARLAPMVVHTAREVSAALGARSARPA